MKKYYRVNLYKLDNSKRNCCIRTGDIESKNKPEIIDQIIVEYKELTSYAREVITGYDIRYFSKKRLFDDHGNIKDTKIKNNILNYYGFQLFIINDEFVNKNKVTIDDMLEYNTNFSSSEFKKLYDGMKIEDKKTKKKINKLVKKMRKEYKISQE